MTLEKYFLNEEEITNAVRQPGTTMANFRDKLEQKFGNIILASDKTSGRIGKDEELQIKCKTHKNEKLNPPKLSFNELKNLKTNPCQKDETGSDSKQEITAYTYIRDKVLPRFSGFELFPKQTADGSKPNKFKLQFKYEGKKSQSVDVDIFVEFNDDYKNFFGKKGLIIQVDGPTHQTNFNKNTYVNDSKRGALYKDSKTGLSAIDDFFIKRIDTAEKEQTEKYIIRTLDVWFDRIENLYKHGTGNSGGSRRPLYTKERKKDVPTYKQMKHGLYGRNDEVQKLISRAVIDLNSSYKRESTKYFSHNDGKKKYLSQFLETTNGYKSFVNNKSAWDEIIGNNVKLDRNGDVDGIRQWMEKHQATKQFPLFSVDSKGNKKLFESEKHSS